MLLCKTSSLGYSYFECPNRHKSMYIYDTCNDRFCNSCGVKHIPEENFKTIRYYGFYSSKSHPPISTARMLIEKTKIAFYKSLNNWRNLMMMSFSKDPLLCSCGTIMQFIEFVPPLE